MKENTLHSIDISKVDSLETFIWHLGLMCVSIKTLITLQEKAESLGIFDTDETEASKMVKYQAQKLITCSNDLLTMCSARTGKEWTELMQDIIKKNTTAKPPKKGKKK